MRAPRALPGGRLDAQADNPIPTRVLRLDQPRPLPSGCPPSRERFGASTEARLRWKAGRSPGPPVLVDSVPLWFVTTRAARTRTARCRVVGCWISGDSSRGTFRGLPPPRPVVTAMYCLPPALNETGKPCTDVPRRVSQRMLAGSHVEGAEVAIEIADERDAAGGRQHRRQERRALLVAPDLVHRPHVVGRELADLAVGARHLEEAAIGLRPARAFLELDLAAARSPGSVWLSGMISRLLPG